MTIKNFDLPICQDCRWFPWCKTIPQECTKERHMTKEVYCWFGDQYIIVLVDDVDEDMTDDDICEIATDILLSNLGMEVIDGEEN